MNEFAISSSIRSPYDVNDLSPGLFESSDSSMPDLQLVRRIVSQVEFYLSDDNLAKDAFLLKHVQKNKMGFVSIKLLTSFKKVGNQFVPKRFFFLLKPWQNC